MSGSAGQPGNASGDGPADGLQMFARELRAQREAAGLTEEQLAKLMGCSASVIAMLETCRTIPSPEHAKQADAALKTPGTFVRLLTVMEVDPSAQAVIALTHEGFLREGDGDIPGAMAIYERALALAEGDHAQCVAAHFMARHRADAAEELKWNLRALELARKVGDDRVAEYFASFLGCVGSSYERLGEPALARRYREEGMRHLADVRPGEYRDGVEASILAGLKRVSDAAGAQD